MEVVILQFNIHSHHHKNIILCFAWLGFGWPRATQDCDDNPWCEAMARWLPSNKGLTHLRVNGYLRDTFGTWPQADAQGRNIANGTRFQSTRSETCQSGFMKFSQFEATSVESALNPADLYCTYCIPL